MKRVTACRLLVACGWAVLVPTYAMVASPPRQPGLQRQLDLFSELAARAGLGGQASARQSCEPLKAEVLELLAPFGDPAVAVSQDVFDQVDRLCQRLEVASPTSKPATASIAAIDGRWQVRYSNAPPPSNGAIGPFVGEAFQVVDSASQSYTNELLLFGGAVEISLQATFEASGDDSLRVAFKTLTVSLLGGALTLPAIRFPEGTERTWLLTYADQDTRLVRAGVDGGRSTARELGLLDQDEGEASDSYLFVLTKAANRSARVNASKLKALKTELLAACEGQDLGAASSEERVAKIAALMDRLAAVNPTPNPASSPLLVGTWDVIWTTETELLFLTEKGFFGLPCSGASQSIRRRQGEEGDYALGNLIDFDGRGSLSVGSTCEPAAMGGRVDFKFQSCSARWNQVKVPLPPVGQGWFEVLYIDNDLRICRDSRGDLQICQRRA